MSRSPASAVAALLTAAVAAQEPALPDVHPGYAIRTVAAADVDSRPALGLPTQQPLVATDAGQLVLAVQRRVGPGSIDARNRIELLRSADGGLNWSSIATVPHAGAGPGASLGAHGDRVHAAWTALGDDAWLDAWVAVFDANTGRWLGAPHELAHATGAEDQFLVHDLVVAADGTAAVAVSAHRAPRGPWRPWGAALLVGRAGAEGFGPPVPIEAGRTGVAPDLWLDGRTVHVSYRSFGAQGFGVHRRAFDLAATPAAADRPTDLPVSPGDDQPLESANTSNLLIDPNGGISVLFGRGKSAGTDGRLELAYFPPAVAGTPADVHRVVLADDARLCGGNHNYEHFALSSGGGDHSIAVFSKLEDDHATLWATTIVGGQVVDGPVRIAQDARGAFTQVNGIRDPNLVGQVLAVVAGTTQTSPGGRVAVVARRFPLRGIGQGRR